MNYSRFLNALSLARKASPLRQITAILAESPPSVISMATGMPNGDLFPFKDITYTLRDGSHLQLGETETKRALQYGSTHGIAELVTWLTTLQKQVHNPPTMNLPADNPSRMSLCVTAGSQDGISKAVDSLVQKGDNVLIESLVYSGTLAAIKPYSCNLLPVSCDGDGMQPESLADILSEWKPSDADDPSSNIPKFLYCVPNGGNPTGHGLTLQRKKHIYELAQKYNLLILEDDPYFYIQFSEIDVMGETRTTGLQLTSKERVVVGIGETKLERNTRCFKTNQSVVIIGRMRVGYVTGPHTLVERIELHMQATVLQANSLSQVTLLCLLQNWGHKGFLSHAEKVRDFYRTRCDWCLQAAETHLKGLAEWTEPRGGMFLWLRLLGIPDTHTLIMKKAREKGVMFVPGSAFSIDSSVPSSFVRASYSLSTQEQMNEGFRRLALLIQEELDKK